MAQLVDYRCGLTIELNEDGDCPYCFQPPLLEPAPTAVDTNTAPETDGRLASTTTTTGAVSGGGSAPLCSSCGSLPAARGGRCDFCVDADADAATGYILVVDGHRTCVNDALIIGRDPELSPLSAELALYDDVSRRHGRFTPRTNSLAFEDLGSRNGSFLNDTRLRPFIAATILPGDRVRLGEDCILTIEAP